MSEEYFFLQIPVSKFNEEKAKKQFNDLGKNEWRLRSQSTINTPKDRETILFTFVKKVDPNRPRGI